MSEAPSRRIATASDVARIAGVSRSAVSRAFTPGASVSPKARARIQQAADALGYKPNLIARAMITRRSGIIGVAVGYMDNQFYPALVEALGARLAASGRRLLLFAGDPHEDSDPLLEDILRYQVDALILASTTLSSHLAADCRAANIPVVLINRVTADGSSSSVTGDNLIGGRAIADFLAEIGHKRLAFMAGLENSSTSREREQGFFEHAAKHGLAKPARAVGHYRFDAAKAAARTLLARKQRPDAIFCANDHMAFAAIEVARYEFGLDIGRDLSIVGFDDAPMAAWASFSLTTYSQPIDPMADAAIALIDAPAAAPVHRRIPGALIIRNSTRRA